MPFLAAVSVLLLLEAAATATTTSASASSAFTPFPDFQQLNVQELLSASKSHVPDQYRNFFNQHQLSEQSLGNPPKYRLQLIHRDRMPVPHSSVPSNISTRFRDRMERDVRRVNTLSLRLSATKAGALGDKGGFYGVDDFGSDVVSGMDQGSGEYFVRIGVGSPPRSQYMVIDSGSDIVWVQCQPCSQCYQQTDPVFNPAESATFNAVLCRSSVCDRLENAGCNSGRCRYEVSYGDGSFTKGTLAFETLTFGRTMVQDVAIGCGHMNRGMFVGAAGLLGLGCGSMSFVGQLGGQTGGAFRYCLVSRGTGESGSLEFGREAMPVGAAWVPLMQNPRSPSFYYVGLSGLGVGGIRVPIPEDAFALGDLGVGGVVMDTGTAVTRFPGPVYNALRDAFVSQTTNLPGASPISIFDTCYDLNGFVMVRVPTVSFYFSGGPILTLPARNFLIPVDDAGTFCFAFAPTGSDLSIIGNIQQEGIQVSIDTANGFVGFGPNVC